MIAPWFTALACFIGTYALVDRLTDGAPYRFVRAFAPLLASALVAWMVIRLGRLWPLFILLVILVTGAFIAWSVISGLWAGSA